MNFEGAKIDITGMDSGTNFKRQKTKEKTVASTILFTSKDEEHLKSFSDTVDKILHKNQRPTKTKIVRALLEYSNNLGGNELLEFIKIYNQL